MRPISDYNSNLGTAVLLTGGAGTGKTSMGLRLFRNVYCFVADPNFKSGVNYLTQLKQSGNIVGFDYAALDANNKELKVDQRYSHMLTCLNTAEADPKVETIFMDSAIFIEDIIKARICLAKDEGSIRLEGFTQWGQLILFWKQLIMGLRTSGKKVIMAAHESKEQDEADKVYKYQIAVDGQIRSKFPAIFSDVIRCEINEPQINKPVRQVRPLGNTRFEYLKNTYGLNAVLDADEFVRIVQAKEYSSTPPISATPVAKPLA